MVPRLTMYMNIPYSASASTVRGVSGSSVYLDLGADDQNAATRNHRLFKWSTGVSKDPRHLMSVVWA